MIHNIANSPGIYQILNEKNARAYYGSAANLRKRFSSHFCLLRKNKHRNRFLQNDYNKYNQEECPFTFNILELCNIDELLIREQIYLDKFWDGCVSCYNINNRAESANLGKIFSDSWRKNLSESHKGHVPSIDTKAKLSAANKGRKKPKNYIENFLLGSNNPRAKSVIQILENDAQIVHKTINDALKYINGNPNNHVGISNCCRGKQKTSYGFRWKYNEESIPTY